MVELFNTDYLTDRTQFNIGSSTLSSTEHGFLQKAVSDGVIMVDKGAQTPYDVTNEETPYAAGEHQFGWPCPPCN